MEKEMKTTLKGNKGNEDAQCQAEILLNKYFNEDDIRVFGKLQKIHDFSYTTYRSWYNYVSARKDIDESQEEYIKRVENILPKQEQVSKQQEGDPQLIEVFNKYQLNTLGFNEMSVKSELALINTALATNVLRYVEKAYKVDLTMFRDTIQRELQRRTIKSIHYRDILYLYLKKVTYDTLQAQAISDAFDNLNALIKEAPTSSSSIYNIWVRGDTVVCDFHILGVRDGESYIKMDRVVPVLQAVIYYTKGTLLSSEEISREFSVSSILQTKSINITEPGTLFNIEVKNSGALGVRFYNPFIAEHFFAVWFKKDFNIISNEKTNYIKNLREFIQEFLAELNYAFDGYYSTRAKDCVDSFKEEEE